MVRFWFAPDTPDENPLIRWPPGLEPRTYGLKVAGIP
jgi:hypothetical protein